MNRIAPIAPILRWSSLIIIPVLLLSVVGIRPALAQPHTVIASFFVAPGGNNDANTCTNPISPCLTINHAISQASGGEGIAVASGTYYNPGTDAQVVLIDKNISLLGGYDSGFTTQNGTTIIDGQYLYRGITIQSGFIASLAYFTVQNGYHASEGGGIWNAGTLILSNSVVNGNVSLMGGGIYNSGTLTVNNSTISNNVAGQENDYGFGGGGIENFAATLTLNNSTLSGNSVVGDYTGAGIDTDGTLVLNNSTLSGNTVYEAIFLFSGTLDINSSTIAGNSGGGIWVYGGTVTMQNSILARNSSASTYDCYGDLLSGGYNILGDSTGCAFTPSTDDQVGTAVAPINPLLAPLGNNGGLTQTVALSDSSPALNAGNPATPGGAEAGACPATDQRGTNRDADRCDIGAYEGSVPVVVSIVRSGTNPTSAPNVYFTVTFSSPVTGVDLVAPFSDFKLTTTGGITSAKVREVTGSDSTYTVRVYTGTGNGTIRLDVKDIDTILNKATSVPLGGPGLANGNFTNGQKFKITRIPKATSPAGLQWDNTPTFSWTTVPQATQYNFQVYKGTTLLYSRLVAPGACGASSCSNTPATILSAGGYKWRVRAMTQGTWKPFSAFKSFAIDKPDPGLWFGTVPLFYVSPDSLRVLNFSVVVDCAGGQKVTYSSVSIVNRSFSFGGPFQANGTFTGPTSASGTVKLTEYSLPACGGKVSTPLTNWTAYWQSSSQPAIVLQLSGEPSVDSLPDPVEMLPTWLDGDPEAVTP